MSVTATTDDQLQSLAAWLETHIVSRVRRDIKSRYFPKYIDRDGIQQKAGYAKDLTPVTTTDLHDHLSGRQPVGCYIMDPAADGTVRAAVVDLDDKEKELTFEELCKQGLMIKQELEGRGLVPLVMRSGSGHGIHLWLLWKDPQPAAGVRRLLKEARDASGITCHVDIFPAQDRLSGRLGNLVALPLGRASRPLDLAGGQVTEDLVAWNRPEPGLSRDTAGPGAGGALTAGELAADAGRGMQLMTAADTRQFGPVDPDYLTDALGHVSAADFQTWVDVTLAVKVAISEGRLREEDGFRVWEAWCATAPNHDPVADSRAWERHFKPREGGVTLGTVFHLAQQGGWKPPAGQVVYLPGFAPPNVGSRGGAAGVGAAGPEHEVLAETHRRSGPVRAAATRVKTRDPAHYAELLLWQAKQGPPEVQAINEDHFQAYDGGKLFIFKEKWDTALKRYCVERRSVRDFRDANRDQVMVGSRRGGVPVMKAKGDLWLESAHRRRYEEVVFEPSGCEPWRYNLWQGWAHEPSPEGSWSLLRAHVLDNICRRDVIAYEYLMNWLALTCQKPGEHIGVAVIFRGDKGTGKSFFVRMVGRLFGQNFMQVSSTKAVTGHFNAHLRDCVLLFADEISYTGKNADTAALNALITEDTLTVEGKGQNAVTVRNMLHLILATNHAEAVPASADERRFFCLNVGNDQQQVQAYFDAIEAQLLSGGFGRLLWDMLERDISSFNVRRVPQTDELTEQKLNSLKTAGTWWFNRLQEGTSHEETDRWETEVAAYLLYDDYVNFCKKGGLLFQPDDPIVASAGYLSREIWLLLNGDESGHLGARGKKVPVMQRDGSIRSMTKKVWSIPALEDCRRRFCETLRIRDFKWDAVLESAVDSHAADDTARSDDGTLDF